MARSADVLACAEAMARPPPDDGAVGRGGGEAGAAGAPSVTQGFHQPLRRRQIGRIGQPHQRHLGRRQCIGRVAHFHQALEQHLPGACQRRHAELAGHGHGARRFRAAAIEKSFGARRHFHPRKEMRGLQEVLHDDERIGALVV
jgi:hypothetical protein